MNVISYFVILLINFLMRESDSYRILGVFPLAYRSHNIFFDALMKGLAKKGHQVDVISHYESKNYKTVLNLSKVDFLFPGIEFDTIRAAQEFVADTVEALAGSYATHMCELLGHEKMQDFIRNIPKDSPYDVIILEGWILNCYIGLGHILNVPIITATPSLEFPWISRQIGNPLSTAFYPNILRIKKVQTFWDRLQNTVQAHNTIQRFFTFSEESQTEAMRKFLSPDMPNIREVEKTVALSLVNTHHTLQGARPTTPAFIEVAGLHIEEDKSNFTKGLKRWMDESENGVIYISFGTLVPIESLSRTQLLEMYNSFSKIAPTRILIKAMEGKTFPPGLPKNVKTMTWIPQIPVLSHNNTRGFMTHGGVHSIQEAVYYAVPVIGIPLFYDQRQNVEILVNKKMAVQLNLDKFTEKSLDEAFRTILKDPEYREAAIYHSRLFQDRPLSPMETAIFWIEYVIRNGAEPLRSPALNLYWWQIELLDVYGFLLFCLILVFYIISIVFRNTYKIFLRKDVRLQIKKNL
ncbi:UDP-glucuronosyltransferase 2B1-like [Belonocnema kinseyi]|uniref:UDP-glucuronosyltransferase 2B1-like n=1 Tax=Belonocnema kinseyi TaxID=2817044 RepID=UPI00143D4F6F|nr:UDP-glucuronosyltransferase 2B1-like [Belonocnema kinseyi]